MSCSSRSRSAPRAPRPARSRRRRSRPPRSSGCSGGASRTGRASGRSPCRARRPRARRRPRRDRVAAAAVADHRVQSLRDDHRQRGLLVDPLEQERQPVGGQEQASTARGRCGGSTCRCRGTGRRPRSPPRRRAAVIPWSDTIAGSTPARVSSRNSRSAMLTTIWMCTQEWSDMSRRSALTCCMYHQACRRRSPFAAASSASSRRLPRVGTRISKLGNLHRGYPTTQCLASRSSTATAAASPTSGCRSPTAATSAASTACRPRACRGSSATRSCSFEEIERLVRVLAAMGVTRPAPHRRRAAGPARVPAARVDARSGARDRGPLAHHQRLPARARRRRRWSRRASSA